MPCSKHTMGVAIFGWLRYGLKQQLLDRYGKQPNRPAKNIKAADLHSWRCVLLRFQNGNTAHVAMFITPYRSFTDTYSEFIISSLGTLTLLRKCLKNEYKVILMLGLPLILLSLTLLSLCLSHPPAYTYTHMPFFFCNWPGLSKAQTMLITGGVDWPTVFPTGITLLRVLKPPLRD